MPPIIALASATDLPAVIALLRAAQLPPAGIEDLVATTLVAREDGPGIVGSSALELYGRFALLRSVAVDAGRRGTGLGRRLTQAALDLARSRGVETVYLITETAGGFFPRFGFRPVDRAAVDPDVQRSIQFTKACPASALVMRLDLTQPLCP